MTPANAAPLDAELARIVEAVGFAKTARPLAHARPIMVWRLLDRTKAEEWLRTHPEPPDDEPPAATVQQALFPVLPQNDTGAAAATAAPVL
ncbi:MAG: hypothetical protein AB7U73_23280, partial [Pirellulales bacterium]